MPITEKNLIEQILQYLAEEQPNLDHFPDLKEWAGANIANARLLEKMKDPAHLDAELNRWRSIDPAVGYQRWSAGELRRSRLRQRNRRIYRQIAYCAVASLIVVVIGIAVFRSSKPAPIPVVAAKPAEAIMPGQNTAILTLSNGQQEYLDKNAAGQLAKEGGAGDIRWEKGALTYQSSENPADTAARNTLTTDSSGQYQVTLADGSRVWLNNLSSLRYPVSFQGKERRVELTGEAYFEIAKDAAHPFVVQVKNTTVNVLGTRFDIMAYRDEPETKATLVDGSISVKAQGTPVLLAPDQQVVIDSTGAPGPVRKVAAEEVISWKDGLFYVGEGTSLQEVMRQLARWYHIEIVFEGKVPPVAFVGKIDRNVSLQEFIKFLNKDNSIRVRIEGRKMTILPS